MPKLKVLLTGVTGFIGKELGNKLIQAGHEVYGLVRYSSDRPFSKLNVPQGTKVIYGDLRDNQLIRRTVKLLDPEVVFHLAAITPVYYSHDHPYEVMESNLTGTMNLALAASETNSLRQFVFAGTSEEYGNQETFPISETAPLRPNQPYAIAKVAADNYLQYLGDSQGFPYVVVRPFNTFGRIDTDVFVTESIISQMLKGKEHILLGDPSPQRDFMYLMDHVNGYIKVLETGVTGGAFNLCTGTLTSIAQLADKIKELTGYKGEISWKSTYFRPTEINRLEGNNTKAKSILGWSPHYTLEGGLQETIDKWKAKLIPQATTYV